MPTGVAAEVGKGRMVAKIEELKSEVVNAIQFVEHDAVVSCGCSDISEMTHWLVQIIAEAL